MKTYTTLAAISLSSGTIALTPAQAATRAPLLEANGQGLFDIKDTIYFKAGETFGYNLDIPKVIADCVETVGERRLEDLDLTELFAFAVELGLSPHPNTGKPKLILAIKSKQDELLAEQDAAARSKRISELDAKGEDLTDEEKAELETLLES